MKEYKKLLDFYSFQGFYTTSSLSFEEWKNTKAAEDYLSKYWLPYSEYEHEWEYIKNKMYINQTQGLPHIVFPSSYNMLALRGGCLFAQEDFEQLKKCMLAIGDKYWVIIQNTFGEKLNIPVLRMKYPTSITWNQLMSGGFISSALFDLLMNEYFVFSESAVWGKYTASDYEHPLDIIGFKSQYALIFKDAFRQPQEEWDEIKQWLPEDYKDRVEEPWLL